MNIFKKNFFIFTAITVFFYLLSAGFIVWHFPAAPDEIIFSQKQAEAVGAFGSKNSLIEFLVMGLIIFGVNLTIAETLFYRQRVLALSLLVVTSFLSVIHFIASVFLITINK